MEKIKAIIIDDEERGRNTLSSLVGVYCDDVEIIATCSNVPEGVIAINKYKPDLVFLDVEMPVYNGFELLNFFSEVNFEIIFVTAYSDYAIKAFEVSAVDYLLKPVEIDQLKSAVEKFELRMSQRNSQNRLELLKDVLSNDDIKRIAVPVSNGLEFIDLSELVLLEAEGAYTWVHLNNGEKFLVSKKLKFFEDLLVGREIFYRPHRSHLIHLNYIKKYLKGEGTIIMEGKQIVSISRDKKTEFEERLRSLGIMK